MEKGKDIPNMRQLQYGSIIFVNPVTISGPYTSFVATQEKRYVEKQLDPKANII